MMDNIGAQSPLAGTAAACICLAFVVGLILAAARLAKRLPALRTLGQAGGGIALVGSLALDRTHRLHLVQIGEEQALVVTGGAAAVLTLPRAC